MDVFDALGDATRRRIIEALGRGPLSVNEIVALAGIRQSGVSRHLGILYAAGLVEMRPDGARHAYLLQPSGFRAIRAWLASYEHNFAGRIEAGSEAKVLREARRRARAARAAKKK